MTLASMSIQNTSPGESVTLIKLAQPSLSPQPMLVTATPQPNLHDKRLSLDVVMGVTLQLRCP